ncbi:MAG TPA: ATP-binding protein [Gaiella sp.]|nr:ATP-binding protein [Gaiella sp.]
MLRAIPIRWRLAAAFAVSMAALLVALGALVYFRVDDALRSSVDDALSAQAAEALSHPEDGSLLDADARQSGMVVQIVGPDDRLARSDPTSLRALLPADSVAAARRGRFLTTITLGPGEHNRWRALAVPDGERVLVVARPLRQTEETLSHVFRGLIVAGPVGLLLATLGGYLLAAAALRPVESMRRRASAISATTPGARLPVPPSRDEIRGLALTLNEMLARLEAALEHERRFVADASHELRTPLALLKAELELALRRPRDADELRAAVGSAAEETDRLALLADDLLLIARSDQDALGLRIEQVDLGELARGTAERFAERAASEHRNVVVDVPPGTEVHADRLRVEQALRNLVDNALGYGEGTVTITARSAGDATELHVLDEGRGFPADVAARAFERFSRGEDARARGGSGLGLAIVETVAHAHGGTTGIARNGTGTGADVWISLPASPAH